MDEEFDTSVDISDVDTSADMDTSDVVDDVPDDIPEDVPEDEPEMTEEDDLSDDIPEDVPEDEPEMAEENGLSDDVPEDAPAEQGEIKDTTSDADSGDSTEPTEEIQDEPLDDTATKDTTEDTASDVDSDDSTEPIKDTQDELLDDAATEDVADDIATDVDDDNSAEQVEDAQDEPLDDAVTEDAVNDTATDVDDGDTTEQVEDTQDEPLDDIAPKDATDDTAADVDNSDSGEQTEAQKETADDANEFKDGTQYDPSKVLKRDELDLLKSGNNAINQRLEAQADDYRDKGMSEDETRDRLAADKWSFQKEFLEDTFPGQDVSPNMFNGLSENGSKDRIDEIENSDTLKNQLKKEETDTTGDNVPETDNQAIEDEEKSSGVSDGPEVINDEAGDESIKDLRNRFAAFLNKQDIPANAQNDTKEVNKDVESAQKMIDDYCNNDLKGVLSDDKKAVRLGDTVEFQDDEVFAKGLGSKDRAAGVNGYNNGKKSYVKNSGPHPKKTAIHEHNHQLSCNDVRDSLGNVTEYKRGVSINGKDRQVNEALTELFTKKMMGADYPANPNVGYRDNMLRMEKMESGFGTDVLKEAYYQNKPDLLKSKYESVMGECSWKPFSKSFDDSLSRYSDQEIFDKREHYRKYGTNLQTATDVKRQNAITYANKCATLFALKSKGVN